MAKWSGEWKRMPGGVRFAVFVMGALAIALVVDARSRSPASELTGWTVPALVFAVLLARGHPLARQWALACALFLPLKVVADGSGAPTFGVLVLIGVALAVGVCTRAARRFFSLHCRSCDTYSVRADSMLYGRVRCRECNRAWALGAERADLRVFD